MLQKRSLLTAISSLLLVIVSGSLPVASQPIVFQKEAKLAQSASDNLIPALLDENSETRERAFNNLRGLGGDVAVPALIEALQDKDWQVRVIAAYTLGRLGSDVSAAVPALIAALKDANADVRFSSAQALGKINTEQAVSPLIEALQDKDKNVRFATTDALLQFGSKVQQDNLRTFVRFLANENQTPVYDRFTIADAAKPESRLAIPAYIEALGNSNWFIRNQSTDILTKLKVDSISILSNTLSTNADNGFIRGVFTDTFLRTNSDHLIEIIKSSKDAEIRTKAAKVLGMLKDKKAIPSLINALQNEMDLGTAQEIIKALGRIGAEEAVPAILTTWQNASSRQPDDTYELRIQIVKTLEQIASQEAISGLITAFPQEEKSFIAFTTIRKIVKGDTTPEESIFLLKNILESGDIDAIVRIIDPPELVINNSAYSSALKTALQQLGIEKMVSILKPILLQEAENEFDKDSSDNRQAAAKALSVLGADAVPIIVKSFSEAEAFAIFADVYDEDASTQELKKNVLSQVGVNIIPYLIALLRDSTTTDSDVIEVLVKVRSEQAVPFLIEALERESSGGVIALRKFGLAETIPYFIKILQEDSDEVIRGWAAEALGEMSSLEAVPSLIASLKDESSSVRQSAAKALGQIKVKVAIPYLVELLKDKDWTVRVKSAEALKSIGTEAVPLLIEILNSNHNNSSALQTALKDKNADTRRSAVYVLWQMGSFANQASNDLMAVVRDENDNLYVRWMAAAALGNMGQDMSVFFLENNLINPQNLTPIKCPNDLYNPEFDLKRDIDGYYEEMTIDTNKLVYVGRCIYGDSPQEGGNIYGFYERLKALLNRR